MKYTCTKQKTQAFLSLSSIQIEKEMTFCFHTVTWKDTWLYGFVIVFNRNNFFRLLTSDAANIPAFPATGWVVYEYLYNREYIGSQSVDSTKYLGGEDNGKGKTWWGGWYYPLWSFSLAGAVIEITKYSEKELLSILDAVCIQIF